MTPRPHQIEGASWALDTIRRYGLAYLSWQERTGKTLTALLAAEYSKADNILIITKKAAIKGWEDTLRKWPHSKKFTVINYESAHKVSGDFDFIILDEAHHAISSTGRPSKTWKVIAPLCRKKAILYLSATPYAEHLGLIYHQLKLSHWTPFKERNFYDWFRAYGVPHMTRTPYGLVETYTRYQDAKILKKIGHLFNFKTREDVGIEHEPEVNVVHVPLKDETREAIETMLKDEIFEFGDVIIPLDTPMKTRTVHYQLEGGTLKLDKGSLYLPFGREKIEYIHRAYPNKHNIAIMAHFVAERALLEQTFPDAMILSSDGHAEGVDLHRVDKLIIYSMSFKTSKYTQRLARQANHERKTPIIVDVLVCDKPAIGFSVYETVAIKKQNFDKNSYEMSL